MVQKLSNSKQTSADMNMTNHRGGTIGDSLIPQAVLRPMLKKVDAPIPLFELFVIIGHRKSKLS